MFCFWKCHDVKPKSSYFLAGRKNYELFVAYLKLFAFRHVV